MDGWQEGHGDVDCSRAEKTKKYYFVGLEFVAYNAAKYLTDAVGNKAARYRKGSKLLCNL